MAKHSMWLKDTFREIRHSVTRFLSIAVIIMLGTGFFAGVQAAAPDMRRSASQYYEQQNLCDVRILSTFGFDEADLSAVRTLSGIAELAPGYSADLFAQIAGESKVIRAMSLPEQAGEASVNRPYLKEGRLPEAENECLVDAGSTLRPTYEIGDTITLQPDADDESGALNRHSYRVVGLCSAPQYITTDRDSSKIGSGNVYCYIMIPPENFSLSVYTELNLTLAAAKGLSPLSDEYREAVESAKSALETIAQERAPLRLEAETADARASLADAQAEYDNGEKKLNEELADARAKLDNARAEYESGVSRLEDGRTELAQQKQAGEQKLNDAKEKLEQGEAEYAAGEQKLNDAKTELEKVKAERDSLQAQLKALYAAMEAGTAPDDALHTSIILEGWLQNANGLYREGQAQLKEQEQALAGAKEQLTAARAEYEAGQAALKAELQKAQEELASAQTQLARAKREIEDGEATLAATEREQRAELSQAKQKLDDAKAELAKAEAPEWYVFDRENFAGYTAYFDDADRIQNIAKVFPAFLLLVAVLVCLTTMTRMIDEQRTMIGTYKALGYSNGVIMAKYLIYGGTAAIVGAVTGLLIGYWLFPTVIMNAYGIMYTIPVMATPVYWGQMAVIVGIALLVALVTVYATVRGSVRAQAAQLLRPKAPKPGKRVFLERIPFLWKRFNFMAKITTRNLLRYKKRVLMTVVGISGCTALVVAGFGLRDSIDGLAQMQFDTLFRYDIVAVYDSGDDSARSETAALLTGQNGVTGSVFAYQQEVTVKTGHNRQDVSLVVPETPDAFDSMVVLRDEKTHEPVPLTDGGAVVSRKLAELAGLSVGDEMTYTDGDMRSYPVKITGVVENYVRHFIYLTPAYYRQTTGEAYRPNSVYATVSDAVRQDDAALRELLTEKNFILTCQFKTNILDNFDDVVHNLSYIVLVMILCAGLLALVVIYNLTNINITERIREIATLKVLGFYDGEVSQYVFRENMGLTVLGSLFGLILGYFLHSFIMHSAESDIFCFDRTLYPQSFVGGVVLTLGFSLLVSFVLFFKLRRIDMVESLKSVE